MNGISTVSSLQQRNRGRQREREMWAHFQSSVVVFDHPRERRGVVAAHRGNPCRFTNCEASHSVLDFPQYKIECSVNRPTTRSLFLTYDVPYRSIMYLLYPCVNKIQFKTSVHISILFWPHWMLGCTHSSTTDLVNEGLCFCISQSKQSSLETALLCPVVLC